MSINEATAELTSIKSLFNFLNDTPAVYREWESRVKRYSVSGKNAHDARIVSAMLAHGVSQLLTFNDDDFKRFTDIIVLTPAEVLSR